MPVDEYEISEGTQINNVVATPTTDTATPKYGAIRPKSSDGQGTQGWQLLLYPIPDGTVSLTYRYSVVPEPLSNDNRFPLGGRQHAELFLASCISVAEERENDGLKTGQGPAYQKFMERLAAAISVDKHTGQATDDVTSWEPDQDDTGNSIKSLVGFHMGFGQNSKAWTSIQLQKVLEVVRQGVRRFYVPPPLPGRNSAHVWSFLYPKEVLNTTANVYTYDLPADFGGMDSPMTYQSGENAIYPDVMDIGEAAVRRRLQASTLSTGRPTHYGIRQKSGVQDGGTAYEMVMWPVPDDSYALEYRYRVQPSNDVSIIHGGDAHFQTILEACRAAADRMMNKKQHPHEALFMERLIASVKYDQQLATPKRLGYNRDRLGRYGYDFIEAARRDGSAGSGVTYNGTLY